MDEQAIVAGRDRLLSAALHGLRAEPGVLGILLAGSLAAGSGDTWSDIDLRVVVEPARHADVLARRRAIPAGWPGFLFNEWMPGTQHCVSHFRPFNKIDVFYWSLDALRPSPWLSLPTRVLHDPDGVVATLLAASARLGFVVGPDEVDHSISKGLAAAHEAHRRIARGELLYAATLLDELRQHVMHAADWLHHRTPLEAVHARFHRRGSPDVVHVLHASLCGADPAQLRAALVELVRTYRRQVVALHEAFAPARPLANDLEALMAICPP